MRLMYRYLFLLQCGFLFTLLSVSPALALAYYVSPDGNDTWSGITSEKSLFAANGPFATLERARTAIRELKQSGKFPSKGGVTVFIRAGIYPFAGTFKLSAQDSGTVDSPIVYRSYKNDEVRFIGGKILTEFEPVRDRDALKQLNPAARGNVLVANLPRQYQDNLVSWAGQSEISPLPELFFKRKPMTPARWPKEGWAPVARITGSHSNVSFSYEGDRPGAWSGVNNIWLHFTRTGGEGESFERVRSFNPGSHEITLATGAVEYRPGDRWYAFNVLEELDAPGEWCFDTNNGNLYFWPPEDISGAEVILSLNDDPLVSLDNTQYITIRNISLECTRGDAITISGGTRNLIAGCTVLNIGGTGVDIAGGTKNGVNGCNIRQTGDRGIRLAGGERKTLTPGGNFALNNDIQNSPRRAITHAALVIDGVGGLVSHNRIHTAPCAGIFLSGNEHVIEYNELYDLCREIDSGAFAMGRDWTQRGNMLRYNFFHDMKTAAGFHGIAALLDDFSSGATLFGNIFHRVGCAVYIGGGRSNTVENNIFLNCSVILHLDARGQDIAKKYFDGSDPTLNDRLSAMNYRKPPYSTRYPELLTLSTDQPAVPKNNRLIRNVAPGSLRLELTDGLERSILLMKDNFTSGDPGFMNSAKNDFQLRQDSPVYKMGFQQIPFEEIGLKLDLYRTEMP